MSKDAFPTPAEPTRAPGFPSDAAGGRPWGFWATTGFALMVIVVFLVVHGMIGAPFRSSILSDNPGVDQQELARLLQSNGLYVAVSTLASGTICIALIVLLAWIRRGISVRDYLALKRPGSGVTLTWLIAVACFIVVAEGLKWLLGYELVPEFATAAYSTAKYPPLLWLAVIVMAPLFEEFLFRGFLFAGWSQSKLGATGAIVLTSVLWAAIHTQYELYFIALVFAFGIFAGYARHRTGSLAIPVLVHSIVNIVATINTVIALRT